MKKGFKLLDGAMGTYLHSKVDNKEIRTDSYSLSHEELVYSIHKDYIDAGAEIITTNTFISNYLWDANGFLVEETIRKGINIAKKVAKEKNVLVALDIGPSKSIDENHFKEMILIGAEENVDLYIGETFTNLEEAKALIDIWKCISKKPLIISFSLEKNLSLKDGSDLKTIVEMVEGSGIMALGLNCGYGLEHCYEGILKLKYCTDIPLMAKPNIGYETLSGKDEFLVYVEKFNELGVRYIGGCCGSTPEYICELNINFKE